MSVTASQRAEGHIHLISIASTPIALGKDFSADHHGMLRAMAFAMAINSYGQMLWPNCMSAVQSTQIPTQLPCCSMAWHAHPACSSQTVYCCAYDMVTRGSSSSELTGLHRTAAHVNTGRTAATPSHIQITSKECSGQSCDLWTRAVLQRVHQVADQL